MKKPTQNIALIAFSDLTAMYGFLLREWKECEEPQIKKVVYDKIEQVKKELYERTYGYNPHTKISTKKPIEGELPENIDLSKFDEGR